jgi:hypothetical protein
MLPRALRALAGTALALLSCGDPADRRIYLNVGTLCLRPDGNVLHAEVKLLECLSSACNKQVAGTCSITQDEQKISVSSRLVVEANGAAICATDCGSWIVRCELPQPAAGAYTLTFGPTSAPLGLPLAMDTELVASGTTRGCSPLEP